MANKIENKANFTNKHESLQSALWKTAGFEIYKADGFWNYSKGEIDNWKIDGRPFDTKRETIEVIERHLKNNDF